MFQSPSKVAAFTLENRLLSSLPAEEYGPILSKLEGVTLPLGHVLHEPGGRLGYIYFPTSCVVSYVYSMEDGATAGVGLSGNDGVVGISLFLGGSAMPNQALVQIKGDAFRMKAKILQEEFARGGHFQRVLLRYTQFFVTQISQTAVCNRLHPVEKRLCRWLLMSRDRVYSDELQMTQEFIANALGGRRESVTVAAGHLQDSGLISYSRGHIRIIDRQGLEAAACECYQIVKNESDQLFRALSFR